MFANFSVNCVLGQQLRKARLKAGLTQEELAFKAKISRNYVSLLELDEKPPTVHVLLRVCKSIGIKASSVIASIERD